MKKQSRLFWADVSLLIAAAIKLWRQLFSARRKSKNKEIIAENIICCRQYFSASWRARKISRPLGAEELINCGFYFGPYFFIILFFPFYFLLARNQRRIFQSINISRFIFITAQNQNSKRKRKMGRKKNRSRNKYGPPPFIFGRRRFFNGGVLF